MMQISERTCFTDYIEHKLMYSRNDYWAQDAFRRVLRGFEWLNRDIDARQQYLFVAGGESFPSFVQTQGTSLCLFLQEVIPIWRREFNQLYFSPDMSPGDQTNICKHAVAFLRSWGETLNVMRMRIVSWASLKHVEALKVIRMAAVRRRKKEKQPPPSPDFETVTEADRAAASLLDEVQAEQELRNMRLQKKLAKQSDKHSTTATQNPMDALKELLKCPISQVCLVFLHHVMMFGRRENTSALLLQRLMQDPVILSDGHTYERSAAEVWLQTNSISPVTGEPLAHERVVRNQAAACLVAQCLEQVNKTADSSLR